MNILLFIIMYSLAEISEKTFEKLYKLPIRLLPTLVYIPIRTLT